ncbi:hypothetical protein E4T42_07761 [Aureobasidium subglaciale]|nr:hypothetical protein E4T42_07761 [Aureobasidium subglaciale]
MDMGSRGGGIGIIGVLGDGRALYFFHCMGGVSSLKQSSFPYFLALPHREPCDICDRMLSGDCLASSVTASLKWTGHGEPP